MSLFTKHLEMSLEETKELAAKALAEVKEGKVKVWQQQRTYIGRKAPAPKRSDGLAEEVTVL